MSSSRSPRTPIRGVVNRRPQIEHIMSSGHHCGDDLGLKRNAMCCSAKHPGHVWCYGLQMQLQIEQCAETLLENLLQKANKDETFEFRECVIRMPTLFFVSNFLNVCDLKRC